VSDFLTSLASFVERGVAAIKTASLPPQIIETFPQDHPLAGQPAVVRTLKRTIDADGNAAFEYVETPAARALPSPFSPRAEHVTEHRYASLESFARDAKGRVWLDGALFANHEAVILDEGRPELGSFRLPLARHPAFTRWSALGTGLPIEISHTDLANLLLDNREDLAVPTQAAEFGAMLVTNSFEIDDDGERISFAVKTGKRTEQGMPRVVTASFPAFIGAWPPGDEPKFEARFRVRPYRTRTGAAFRVIWINAADYEQAARASLLDAVRSALPECVVLLGHPDARHFVIPS
jgi:hypothetical protein